MRVKRLIFLFMLMSLLFTGHLQAAGKGNTARKYVNAQETLRILQKMEIAQGDEVSFVKSSPTGDKEWQTHLFMVQQGETKLPLITYVNGRDVVVGILIRDGKLIVPKIPVDEIQPQINMSKAQLSQGKRMTFNANAKEVIYMFTDPGSSYCQSIEKSLPAYSGRFKVIVKHFPLEQIHPGAKEKAVEKQCASMSSTCDSQTRQLASQIVEEDIREGTAIGVDAVPFFITQKGAVMHQIPDLAKPRGK